MTLPTRIGRYRIVELLGQGAMGVVYRGRDEGLDRDVAVKVVRGEALDDESKAQFQKEARAAARLQDPHIVTIYEMGEEGDMPFLAMELLDGQDLQRRMREGTVSDPLVALSVIEQVLSGLGHAHARGIVHRDMKPSNVFLHGASAKILDFGVARLGEGLTLTGRIVGTPHYMSPEQVRAGQVDGRSDLFSTALIFYEMVTGAKAYRAGSAVSVMFQIVHEDADLSRLPATPRGDALRRVLRRALARDRAERYPDAAALAAALADAVRSYEGATAFAAEPAILGETLVEGARPVLHSPPIPAEPAPPIENTPELERTDTYDEPAIEPEWELPSHPTASVTQAALPRNPAPSSAGAPAAVASFVATVLVGLSLAGAGVWWWTSRGRQPGVDPGAPAAKVLTEPTPAALAAPTTTLAPSEAVATPAPSASTSIAPATTTDMPPASAPPATLRAATIPPAVSTGPIDVRERLDRADAHFQSGRLGAALAEARVVLRQEPGNEEAQYLVDDIVLDLSVEKHLKDARAALARGDRGVARREVDEGLALKPNESRLSALARELER